MVSAMRDAHSTRRQGSFEGPTERRGRGFLAMLMLVLALLVVRGLRLVLVLARLRFLIARRLRFRFRLRLADVVYDELVCGSERRHTGTHFVFAGNYGLASASMAAVVQILLVLQHQNRFGKAAARTQNIDLDELVQDL